MAAAPPFVRLFQYCSTAPQEPGESNWESWLQNERIAAYVQECRAYYPKYIRKPIRWSFGDNISWMAEPTVVKSRIIGDRNAVLMPLNAARHWGRHAPGTLPPKLWTPETLPGMDIPFAKKAQRIVWRGSTTGNDNGYDAHPRTQLVRRWYQHDPKDIDVAFHQVVHDRQRMAPLVRPGMSIQQQLRSAFVCCPEGNDVATNLKWVLASNSVPVMPPPRYETWLLEGSLLPMVHYVPCDPSTADLDQVLAWCRRNPRKCQAIAEQGKEYIAPFFNERQEQALAARVLDRYLGAPASDLDPPPKPPTHTRRIRRRRV
jgi:hypothetical protein